MYVKLGAIFGYITYATYFPKCMSTCEVTFLLSYTNLHSQALTQMSSPTSIHQQLKHQTLGTENTKPVCTSMCIGTHVCFAVFLFHKRQCLVHTDLLFSAAPQTQPHNSLVIKTVRAHDEFDLPEFVHEKSAL